MSTGVVTGRDADQLDEKRAGVCHVDAVNPKVLADADFMNDAFNGEDEEHKQGLWEAAKAHPKACFWAVTMCATIVMESFDMFLNGSFVAQRAFQRRYGVVLGILISFVFAGTIGPVSYTIIAETSAVRLRALSTAVGRAAYYVAEIPMIFLASQMLNPTGWNLVGKCGYVWGGTACVCWVMAYFFLPELKHRSYREADILFNRKVSARKFKTTVIKVTDNE
ncbi:hypothetical protein CSUB01_08806 [Colletotrichum sublineola]|uniref:Major facilitator superfamily (MFS) profile domain-containing protein n=1 Tax=Colletotrichum sublineola TaxID=1173701 RepID=A0A066X5D7_COLSU|nr:hypothetical protein CSUB01_08806 [Colletotrichum sublineola]